MLNLEPQSGPPHPLESDKSDIHLFTSTRPFAGQRGMIDDRAGGYWRKLRFGIPPQLISPNNLAIFPLLAEMSTPDVGDSCLSSKEQHREHGNPASPTSPREWSSREI